MDEEVNYDKTGEADEMNLEVDVQDEVMNERSVISTRFDWYQTLDTDILPEQQSQILLDYFQHHGYGVAQTQATEGTSQDPVQLV